MDKGIKVIASVKLASSKKVGYPESWNKVEAIGQNVISK
jgi:hypothetical protein